MIRRRRICSVICIWLLFAVGGGAQATQSAAPVISLSVSGEVENREH